MEMKGWKWHDSGSTLGARFLKQLRDVLWYIDGHHSVFESRSMAIPDVLQSFSGYNTPELSKHRKRSPNMSYTVLIEHVAFLKESLLSSWIQQKRWAELRRIIDELASSIDEYTMYLRQQLQIVKSKQLRMTVSDSSSVKVLPVRNGPISENLQPLFDTMQGKHAYQFVPVNDFSPSDPKLKYRYMRDLEKGFPFKAVVYTYTTGLNYHYVWKLPEGVTMECAMTENVKVIDEIKAELPHYHNRTMRKAFFKICGRISPGLKPHMLRQIYREITGLFTNCACECVVLVNVV